MNPTENPSQNPAAQGVNLPETNPQRNAGERPELLSPAGDWDALRAAVQNGADAVYFGLSDFNARHRATNFTVDELPEVMRYLHQHNVRGYVTCNTLIFSEELPAIAEYVRCLNAAQADAVIVQDLGLVTLIRRLAPNLTIHGSTQMTITDARGVDFSRTLGVSRVILARELSVPEISRIHEQTRFPVEVFIHGALCIAYSGQCLTSESLGGRSANRGQCAQACRLPYDLIVDGQARELGDVAYLLSPQDLAAPELIEDLVRSGVSCFKIEGRLKSAQYVAATTQTYRLSLDAALSRQPFELSREQSLTLQQSFSRGFSHGFLSGVDHQELVQGRFPKSRGVKIGSVVRRSSNGLVIVCDEQHQGAELPLKPGDGVVFDEGHPDQDEQGGRVFAVQVIGQQTGNLLVELQFGAGDLNLSAVAEQSLVWKTDDPALRRKLQQSYGRDQIHHRIGIAAKVTAVVGQPLSIALDDFQGHNVVANSQHVVQAARSQPVTVAGLREQLNRLGESPFELVNVVLAGASGPIPEGDTTGAMVPKSVLNDLRREAVALLERSRQESRRPGPIFEDALSELRAEIKSLTPVADFFPKVQNESLQSLDSVSIQEPKTQTEPRLSVLARNLDQLDAVLRWQSPSDCPGIGLVHCDFEDPRRYGPAVKACRQRGIPISLATLRVVKPNEDGWLRQIGDHQPDYVLIRNTSAMLYFQQKFPQIRQLGDYSLNVANELTALLLTRQGMERLVPSYDLNWQQLQDLLNQLPAERFEIVAHQHMPMFHMEHCVFCHTLSTGKDYRDCGRPCDVHRVDLRDRVGESHPLVADIGCRNTLYNAHAQSTAEYIPRMKELGLRWFRIELLRETQPAVDELLDTYSKTLTGKSTGRNTFRDLQILNHLGVTRGPLEFE